MDAYMSASCTEAYFVDSFRSCSTLFLAGLLISAASGQTPTEGSKATPPAPKPETSGFLLRTSADLVLVDVIVTDHDRAVHGLDRGRFHIFEDGHEQAIATFDEHQPATAPPAVAVTPLPPHTYTNVPSYPEASAVNVLLLDGLNTQAADQMDVRRQMLEYLGTIKPGTSLAIFTLGSHLRQLSGFTTDASLLTRALKGQKANPQSSGLLDPGDDKLLNRSITELSGEISSREIIQYMQLFIAEKNAFQSDRRVEMTLEALQLLARYLSGVPGRKNLVWFSSSFPIALDPDSTLVNPFMNQRNYSAEIQETSDLLAAARVAVYPVDARGLLKQPSHDASNSSEDNMMRGSAAGMRPTADAPSYSIADERFTKEVMAERNAMQLVAAATGGKEYINTNGFKEAVASAFENGSSYYTIGYVPGKQFDGQFRKLQLRMDKGGYKLAYRRGYYADPPDRPSEHTPGAASLIMAATQRGAPPATQILFQARVLPATDPLFDGAKLPEGPAGELTSTLKAPAHRVIADLKVDPRGLAYEQTADGTRQAKVEFALVAYDAEGKRTNYLDQTLYLNLRPEQYTQALTAGIPARLAIDLPQGEASLRIAVHDLNAGRAGSLEVPLSVPSR
jgi:VWFA-related protein